MNKHCFALLAALLIFTGSISVLKAENKNVLPLPALQRSTDTGYIRPNANNTIDLGTSSFKFKDAYLAGDIAVDGDIRASSFLGSGSYATIISSGGTAIEITGTFCVLDGTAPQVNMTATPAISTANVSAGDYLVLTSTGDTTVLTEGDAEDLRLGSSTRAIGQYDTLFLVYVVTGTIATSGAYWQEISFIAN